MPANGVVERLALRPGSSQFRPVREPRATRPICVTVGRQLVHVHCCLEARRKWPPRMQHQRKKKKKKTRRKKLRVRLRDDWARVASAHASRPIRIFCLVPAAGLQLKNRLDITARSSPPCALLGLSWPRCDINGFCRARPRRLTLGPGTISHRHFRLSTPRPAQSTPRSLGQLLLCHARWLTLGHAPLIVSHHPCRSPKTYVSRSYRCLRNSSRLLLHISMPAQISSTGRHEKKKKKRKKAKQSSSTLPPTGR
ncbi:hypothetical protein B0J12DRAFT_84394 [Macrophomina phaseolina]|uniref:Uncharacterized protein n=1 Tax=Macrophomina phaseolina TaxID=35725 RepID=A0ABQ8GCA6_9PEZI|nr:hypothetical protein B0J12DRAFT_84394 [Macrophomina phaseolina]